VNGNNADIGDINNKKPIVLVSSTRYLFDRLLLLLLFVGSFFVSFVRVV
jgi:hypothetical protein